MLNETQKRIHEKTVIVAKKYLKDEVELISQLQEVEAHKVNIALGFDSMFAYCTKCLHLPKDRALCLINVQRKCVEVPALKNKIEEGKIDLSSARRMTSVLTPLNQDEWLKRAEELPKSALEKHIASVNPEKVRESVRIVDKDRYALKLGISEELLRKLRRLQALLTNQRKKPVSLEDVLAWTTEETLKRVDPLQKKGRGKKVLGKTETPMKEQGPGTIATSQGPGLTQGTRPEEKQGEDEVIETLKTHEKINDEKKIKAEEHSAEKAHPVKNTLSGLVTVGSFKRTPIPASIKRAVLQRDQAQCQYKVGGHKCGSTYFIHLHHRKSIHQGGEHSLENLVVLCRAHHAYWHEHLASKYQQKSEHQSRRL